MKLYEKASSRRDKPLKHLKKLLMSEEILYAAWENLNRDTNSVGVDCVSIRQVERSDVDEFLETVREELKTNRYRADNVRRVDIPKEDGSQRHLGIMTVKDRLVQNAMKLVLEPIFEADFQPGSYGYRPKRAIACASSKVEVIGTMMPSAPASSTRDTKNVSRRGIRTTAAIPTDLAPRMRSAVVSML